MKPSEFTYWLRGVLEAADCFELTISECQDLFNLIKDELGSVEESTQKASPPRIESGQVTIYPSNTGTYITTDNPYTINCSTPNNTNITL